MPNAQVTPWAGPRPPSGTHRYVFLAFEQPGQELLEVSSKCGMKDAAALTAETVQRVWLPAGVRLSQAAGLQRIASGCCAAEPSAACHGWLAAGCGPSGGCQQLEGQLRCACLCRPVRAGRPVWGGLVPFTALR